jgi:hypothetical protein
VPPKLPVGPRGTAWYQKSGIGAHCARRGAFLQCRKPAPDRIEFGAQDGVGLFGGARARDQEDINARQCGAMQAKTLPDRSPDAISRYCKFGDLARYRHAKPGGGLHSGPVFGEKAGCGSAFGVAAQRREIGWPQQTRAARQLQSRRHDGSLRDKTLAPFRAPCVQHQAAATGFHARTKAVGTGVLEIAGLKGAFHVTSRGMVKMTFKDIGGGVLLSISLRLA